MPKKLPKCLSCCMGDRAQRDGQDFNNIGVAQPKRVEEVATEEGASVSPPISTGMLLEGPAANGGAEVTAPGRVVPDLTVVGKKMVIGNLIGDAIALSSDDDDSRETLQKSVHFAMCHDDPDGKDTRDQYRNTPVKEKRSRAVYPVEHVFFKATAGSNDYVKIPLTDLKRYVTEYVREIVQCSMAAVAEEDLPSTDDVIKTSDVTQQASSDTESLSTDDGIASDSSSDEIAVVNNLVADMLSDITKALSEEQSSQLSVSEEEEQPHVETSHTDEESEVSLDMSDTVTQIESASSLEWDGYETMLKEDPAHTDISIKCPEISTGNAEHPILPIDISTSNVQGCI